jgi:hypothetical protein
MAHLYELNCCHLNLLSPDATAMGRNDKLQTSLAKLSERFFMSHNRHSQFPGMAHVNKTVGIIMHNENIII